MDYETPAGTRAAALSECGPGCSVVLTFARCAAYAADQDADSTAVGWAESYATADGARQTALAECRSRGGSGCVVRVWGCNDQAIEEGLNVDRAARRQIQQGLRAEGFDSGGADGVFGPRTRAAIRSWQSSRGTGPTGYLDGPAVEALRSAGGTAAAKLELIDGSLHTMTPAGAARTTGMHLVADWARQAFGAGQAERRFGRGGRKAACTNSKSGQNRSARCSTQAGATANE